MTISVRVIADSINEFGNRITTFQLRYPRFIHAELMTHRKFSRNASSSRAIPVKRIIADIKEDPAIPLHWGKNQPGMQAHDELDDKVIIPLGLTDSIEVDKEQAWLTARDRVIKIAEGFDNAGYHKQIVNRLLEPWSHINVLVTSTEFNNFYHLRCHPDAQPEIEVLATQMRLAAQNSKPVLLAPGEWHLPYIKNSADWAEAHLFLKKGRITRDEPSKKEVQELLLKVSVARCARVSYLLHSGRQTTVDEDLILYAKLLGSAPLHASPAEHQATPDTKSYSNDYGGELWDNESLHGNFTGWNQYRKTLPYENVPG
ncbi:putative thymidylate synthase [Erwinia phage vB_EamP_Frozen]|uniref:Thymidylate synthase n=2 Tax=Johnsonvirus frozen TaxID=1982578 RepID=A0A191ZCR0_9CAUD|nr:putative thymidylate synthase [Erwinia phage vB_EamP_Frozen]ANJ65177.1 putative thymidylate synthase [Erwinia phage vB_EamP_Frozen]ANJ65353.1 putative thymidylate synthase [Erwinia phage vB_EamP_Gutmeister]